ncbi:MAG: DsbA family protein [Acidobacteriota bacterium]|nr:DsbA family protein [Acidobacteriota bacterium]
MRFAGQPLGALLLLLASGHSMLANRFDIVEGNPVSPVKVLIYEDLQCGDCDTLRHLLDDRLLPRYGSRVAFVHRDFPLGKHEWAHAAAVAARWVSQQNPAAGIEFRREILAERNNITPQTLKLWLGEFAARNHLDSKAIVDALEDARLNALVDQDRQGAEARGVRSTPTVYVGGLSFIETIVYEDVARALDQALGK